MARKSNTLGKFTEYTGLALVLPAGTFVGWLIGHYLDQAFHTKWLTVVFIILGSVGGFVSLIRQIMRDSNDDGN